jgi:hypothetical protein
MVRINEAHALHSPSGLLHTLFDNSDRWSGYKDSYEVGVDGQESFYVAQWE